MSILGWTIPCWESRGAFLGVGGGGTASLHLCPIMSAAPDLPPPTGTTKMSPDIAKCFLTGQNRPHSTATVYLE